MKSEFNFKKLNLNRDLIISILVELFKLKQEIINKMNFQSLKSNVNRNINLRKMYSWFVFTTFVACDFPKIINMYQYAFDNEYCLVPRYASKDCEPTESSAVWLITHWLAALCLVSVETLIYMTNGGYNQIVELLYLIIAIQACSNCINLAGLPHIIALLINVGLAKYILDFTRNSQRFRNIESRFMLFVITTVPVVLNFPAYLLYVSNNGITYLWEPFIYIIFTTVFIGAHRLILHL